MIINYVINSLRNYKISLKHTQKLRINFVKKYKLGRFSKKNGQISCIFVLFFVNLLAEIDKYLFTKINEVMKNLGYLSAFLGGALAGAAVGILIAPDKGSNTRQKITNTVDEFLKKHNIKLNRKDVGDLIEDLEEAAD